MSAVFDDNQNPPPEDENTKKHTAYTPVCVGLLNNAFSGMLLPLAVICLMVVGYTPSVFAQIGAQESNSIYNDIDRIDLASVSEDQLHPVPGRIQAEHTYSREGTDIGVGFDWGFHYVLSDIDDKDWFRYAIDVDATAIYQMNIRFSSFESKSFDIYTDNGYLTTINTWTSYGWWGWDGLSTEILLEKGKHELLFICHSDGAEYAAINWIDFQPADQAVQHPKMEIEVINLPEDSVLTGEMEHEVLALDQKKGDQNGDGIDHIMLYLVQNGDTVYTDFESKVPFKFEMDTREFENGPATLVVAVYADSDYHTDPYYLIIDVTIANNLDCFGTPDGDAYYDDCEVCVGGLTGIESIDSDEDGVADCVDLCPENPLKTEPGECGCNVPETDSDGDGVPNCNDVCVGGNDQVDYDQDGTPDDCDTDDDNDGVTDLNDCFPLNPELNARTLWYEDVDGDGVGAGRYYLGCLPPADNWVTETGDECPYDRYRTSSAPCGCGAPPEGCPGYYTGVEEQNDENAWNIFPNPAHKQFSIQINGDIEMGEIRSSTGQLMMSFQTKTVNTSELSAGYYWVAIATYNGVWLQTSLVIQ